MKEQKRSGFGWITFILLIALLVLAYLKMPFIKGLANDIISKIQETTTVTTEEITSIQQLPK